MLEPPLYANVILGSPNTAPVTAGALAQLVAALPPGTLWAAGGLGAFQLPVNAIALFMGGHVRTGLEDNPAMDAAAPRARAQRGARRRVAGLAASPAARAAQATSAGASRARLRRRRDPARLPCPLRRRLRGRDERARKLPVYELRRPPRPPPACPRRSRRRPPRRPPGPCR